MPKTKTPPSQLTEFARRAAQRLQDKKTIKKLQLYVPSIDQEITIRNLNHAELLECMEIDDSNDSTKSDRYCIYLAVVEPDLRAVAMELKEMGDIVEPLEVVDIFDRHEVVDIATNVMQISGVMGKKKVQIVDDLKN